MNEKEYLCRVNLDLYDSPNCQRLATQAAQGRYLQILTPFANEKAVQVRLCEDGYIAWLPPERLVDLEVAEVSYQAIALSRPEIESRLSTVINFAQAAMQVPNYYLWGGTVAPNYDCSGLMQAAFAAAGIWLPRDSYQQEALTTRINLEALLPGDLIFFGKQKVDHVALYLGAGYYLHSSGKEMGRNGIAIDPLSDQGDEVSRHYYQKLWSYGRVMESYKLK